ARARGPLLWRSGMKNKHHVWAARSARSRLVTAVAFAGCLTTACTDPTGISPKAAPVDASADRKGRGSTLTCDPDNAGLPLPSGFCAFAVVKNVGKPRHMAVRPNGDLYVALDNGTGVTGGILALRDTDGDGRPDIQERFGDTGANGIAYSDGNLY